MIKGTNGISSEDLKYDDNSIRTLKGLEAVRLRPTQFFTDVSVDGQMHACKEILDNSQDEALLSGEAGLIRLIFFKDYDNLTYQILIIDNGRGLPLGKLLSSFTVLNTSGKYDANSYKFSSGSFGVGSSATAASSKHFRAITVRPDGKGSIYVKEAKVPKQADIIKGRNKYTGTYVFYEPDPAIFEGINEFLNVGMEKILDLLNMYNLFNNYRIIVQESQQKLPDKLWTLDIESSLDAIEAYVYQTPIVYDNVEQHITLDDYLREHFGINKKWAWKDELHLPITKDTDMAYQIYLRCIKGNSTGGCLSMVNTVPMTDVTSHHIVQCQDCIKEQLSKFVDDKPVKDFVRSHYKIPLYLAIDIKYNGAQFGGLYKTNFKDTTFRAMYKKSLDKQLKGRNDHYAELYELLKADIANKFNIFTAGSSVVTNENMLLLKLARPDKFSACWTDDRSKAELFISEGDSASSNEGRNPEFQATYCVRGKPFNSIISADKMSESKLKVMKNEIFMDIMKITGLTPQMVDFSELKYGKIFINVDADPHGKHIANLILGNLYAINPRIIDAGIIYIVTPPYYELTAKNLKHKSDPILIRTADDLVNTLAKHLYYEVIDIALVSPGIFDKPRVLEHREFVEFVRIVMKVGAMIEVLSKEHVIDPIIFEQLTHVSYYLTPQTMDITLLKEVLGYETMFYDEVNNILTISIGRKDIPVSLHSIAESMYKEVLPFLNKIAWKSYTILVTSKNIDYYKETPVCFVQLYQILKSMDNIFNIRRFKGIGSMDPKDKALTCMNPKYRKALRVNSINDVSIIFKILGSDSSYRKKLLEYQE